MIIVAFTYAPRGEFAMADSAPQDSAPQVDTVEDAMAALFKESIFDLPTLVRQAVDEIHTQAQAQDAPGAVSIYIHSTYVLVHAE